MKTQDHQMLEEAYDAVLLKENGMLGMGFQNLTDDKEKMAPPANWDKGFEPPYQIGAGGKETPYIKDGKWCIRVWNSEDKNHYIYSYKDDMFYPEGE